jgi:hypothetical protein
MQSDFNTSEKVEDIRQINYIYQKEINYEHQLEFEKANKKISILLCHKEELKPQADELKASVYQKLLEV